MNGITVGAIHDDTSTPLPGQLLDPFVHPGLPSVISAHGDLLDIAESEGYELLITTD